MMKYVIALNTEKLARCGIPKGEVYFSDTNILKGKSVFTESLTNAKFFDKDQIKDTIEIICTRWFSNMVIMNTGNTYRVTDELRKELPSALLVREVEIFIVKEREDLIDRDLLKEIVDRECLV